ncbi:MAG: hypothetical protein HY836_05770 [Aquabacterium sp.]|uniref:hypothetical protein n=1 Tax=Aquabacterium sp. TaxID=1872578 RepID=UPI0025C168CA|nr:hypothetical protein [Aquabacterium sp.]MBI5925090.1 hypothetical protein [Aquabacterium sp.]
MTVIPFIRSWARACRWLVWLAVIWATSVAAETAPDLGPVRLNGFGSLALTRTLSVGDQSLRRDISQQTQAHTNSFATDSRLGLQLHYDARPDLELVSQVVIKKRLPDSPADGALEWLFASYRPRDDWTIRVGRTNTDIFLLSDVGSVGFAYPWIRPNSDFYIALPLYTMDGVDATWTVQSGDARWKLKGFAGNSTTQGILSINPGELYNFKITPAIGLVVSRENDGLLLRATVAKARVSADMSPRASMALESLRQLAASPYPEVARQANELAKRADLTARSANFYEIGVNYERDNWLISAEFSQVDMDTGTRAARSAYASVGHRFGDLTLYGMVGKSVSSFDAQAIPNWQALGPEAQALGIAAATLANGARVDQRSWSMGARWDVHPQLALKLQFDQFWVAPNGGALWIGDDQQASKPRVWSGGLDFVF